MANGNSEEKNNKTVISHILLQLINHKTYQENQTNQIVLKLQDIHVII
jgi:hypothetical protein